MRKPTPAWPLLALEWHSRWSLCKVMKHSSRLLTSQIPITSHTNLISLSSSSSSCMCSSLCKVITLYVAIFCLPTLCQQLCLTQRLLALFRCCWGLGAAALLCFACWCCSSTLPRWPVRVGRCRRNRVNEIAYVSTRWLYQIRTTDLLATGVDLRPAL